MAGCLFSLAYVLWFRSEFYTPTVSGCVMIGVAGLGALFMSFVRSSGNQVREAALAMASRLRRDPVCGIGAAFLLLLIVQWWNAGRVEVFDVVKEQWTFSPPRFPHLPSAITRPEAGEMVAWFFPAWVLVLGIRSGQLQFRGMKLLLWLVTLNAALLAVYGLWSYAPIRIMPGRGRELMGFATFGYRNHAGAFFTLALLLACGLLLHDVLNRARRERRRGRIAVTAVASGLLLVGATLSLSRAGLVSWLAMAVAAAYGIGFGWASMEPHVRLNAVAAYVGAVCLCFFVADGFGRKELSTRVGQLVNLQPSAELSERSFQARAAYRIWRDNPWFGVGGWGYRYWAGYYVDPKDRVRLGVGKANVHNDPLQFLTEFGAVGAGLLAAAVVVLTAPLFRISFWRQPLVLFPAIGLGITALHSLIDLPFRSPAILWHWAVILAALPVLSPGGRQPYGELFRRAG